MQDLTPSITSGDLTEEDYPGSEAALARAKAAIEEDRRVVGRDDQGRPLMADGLQPPPGMEAF